MEGIHPFDFSRLPKISKQEVSLLQALANYFPVFLPAEKLGEEIQTLVQHETSLPFSFRVRDLQPLGKKEISPLMSERSLFLLFSLAPIESKAFLEMDPFVVQRVIDGLLGGAGEVRDGVSSLTDVEEGLLSFLFLKIFALIFDRTGEQARFHFRMEKISSSRAEVLSSLPEKGRGLVITFDVGLGKGSGLMRLFLPAALSQKIFLESAEKTDVKSLGARLSCFQSLSTELWMELGRTVLSSQEVNGLEIGDVILLEETTAHKEGERLAGSLLLRAGRGEVGGIRASIIPSEKSAETFSLQLDEFEGELS